MVLLGPLVLTMVGLDAIREVWAAVFFVIFLLLLAIFLFILAKRESLYRW